MSDIISKYAKFVDLLSHKTKASKIPWEYDFGRRIVSVWNGDVLLNLTKAQDENYEDVFSIALYNKSGDFIEGFDDSTLSGIDVAFGEGSYFAKMRDLYTLAMRQATGADKALDDFIKAVDGDELYDLPF